MGRNKLTNCRKITKRKARGGKLTNRKVGGAVKSRMPRMPRITGDNVLEILSKAIGLPGDYYNIVTDVVPKAVKDFENSTGTGTELERLLIMVKYVYSYITYRVNVQSGGSNMFRRVGATVRRYPGRIGAAVGTAAAAVAANAFLPFYIIGALLLAFGVVLVCLGGSGHRMTLTPAQIAPASEGPDLRISRAVRLNNDQHDERNKYTDKVGHIVYDLLHEHVGNDKTKTIRDVIMWARNTGNEYILGRIWTALDRDPSTAFHFKTISKLDETDKETIHKEIIDKTLERIEEANDSTLDESWIDHEGEIEKQIQMEEGIDDQTGHPLSPKDPISLDDVMFEEKSTRPGQVRP